MAPRILIFSIAMGADYSFYVKSIATFALIFFGYIISALASVSSHCAIDSNLVKKIHVNAATPLRLCPNPQCPWWQKITLPFEVVRKD